ncbi:MAG TPA: FHA domain-containing protein [Thermoanaerobaculia bacterium]|nr:FHA domain-containing protein [Thermoanaerobaculia bacterium]
MIECSSCQTLNPDAERTCLACGAALSRPAQTGAATLGLARCPAGHPIDPSWKSCPYCDRLQATGAEAAPGQRSTRLEPASAAPPPGPQKTRLEGAPSGSERRTRLEGESWPEPPPPPPSSFTPRPTRLEDPPPPPGGRRTVLQESSAAVPPPPPMAAVAKPEPPPAAAPQPAGGAAPARRLLGVLAAPDLGPSGTVFPVRGGKNTIGASRANDVVLDGDSEVSGEHAVILHRNGTFHLADRLSTNGTWLNGNEVPANGTVPLSDRDRIRCGRIELVFLVIEPGSNDPAGISHD